MISTYYDQVQQSTNGDEAYQIFLNATSKGTNHLGGGFFHAVLSKLAIDKPNPNNVTRAHHVFKAMKSQGVTLGEQNYNKLIKICLKVSDFTNASYFLKDQGNAKSINHLLEQSLKKKHDHDAFQVLTLAQQNWQYDDQTQKLYNFNLRMSLKEGHFPTALKFYELSYSGLFRPDVISGNQIIDHYANKGDVSNANSIYKLRKFSPDQITFNSLMKAGVIGHQKEFIHTVFVEMQKYDVTPDTNIHKHCWKIVKHEWSQTTKDSVRQECRDFYSTCKKVDNFAKCAFTNAKGFAAVQALRMNGSSTIAKDTQAKAMWEVADQWSRKAAVQKSPVTLDFLLQLNMRLGGSGQLRVKGQEVTSGGRLEYMYAPSEIVESEIQSYVKWLNDSIEKMDKGEGNPIETAARAAERLVSIHPFCDQNGRSSRLIMDYILQRYQILPAAVGNDVLYGIFAFAQNGANPTSATESVLEGVKKSYRILN